MCYSVQRQSRSLPFCALAFIITVWASGTTLLPATAHAWSWWMGDAQQPNGHWLYQVNKESFPPRLQPLNTVTADQYLWWIQYAISQWKERTNGALLYADYNGTSSLLANMNSADGVSLVAATTGCHQFDPVCGYMAVTMPMDVGWPTHYLYEADVVFFDRANFGGTGPYPIQWGLKINQQYTGYSASFTGTMIHEVGHVFGFDHSSGNVMANVDPGQNIGWFPTGDDIAGIRTIYPPSGTPAWYWRNLTPTGWSAQSSVGLPGWTHGLPTAAIGAFGGTNVSRVAVGCLGANDLIYFTRAALPLSGSTSWSQIAASSTLKSTRPPGIAARKNGTALWLAAWPNVWDRTTDTCPGAKVIVSTDAFDSGQFVDLNSGTNAICTVQQIAVAHDPVSNRFVMAYPLRAPKSVFGSDPLNDSVVVRTSADGIIWSDEQPLCATGSAPVGGNCGTARRIYADDAVGLACAANGRCMVTYHDDSSLNPTIKVRGFDVSGTAIVADATGGGYAYDKMQRTLPAAATADSAGTPHFLFAELWFEYPGFSYGDWARSKGALWVADSTVVPTTNWNWSDAHQLSKHAPALAAGNQLYTDTYLFYTAP